KSSPEVIYEVCRKWNVASICLAITGIVGLLSNSQLSKLFIIFTTVLYISVFYNLGGTVKGLWQRGNTILRVLLASFAAMVVAANIQLFGAVQFGKIVR